MTTSSAPTTDPASWARVTPILRGMPDVVREPKPSLARRAIALVVLLIAAFILLKVVLGIIATISTAIIVIVALLAVVWAYRTL